MEVGPPEKGVRRPPQNPPPPPPPQWQQHNNGVAQNHSPQHPPPTLSSRSLPPPLTHPPSHQYGQSPFSRPDASLPPIDTVNRRLSGHSDRPSYDPQDNRRPHSGPSHGFQPAPSGPPHPQPLPYSGQREPPQRNPMIKRDPSVSAADESQYRRSPSSHSEHNVNHHPPHEASRGPYQHPHPHQHQQPLPYEPSHQQRTNSYPPPQSPMGAPNQFPAEPYARAPNFQHHEPYHSVNYPQQQGNARNDAKPRKAQRAAQACDSCRTLKAKCDEGRPKCNSCMEKGSDCNYRDPPPKQQDKSNVDFAETLLRIENIINSVPWGVVAQLPHSSELQFHSIEELTRRVKRLEETVSESMTGRGKNLKEETPKPEAQDVTLESLPPHREQLPRHSNISDGPLLPVEPEHSSMMEDLPMHDEASEEDEGGAPRPHRLPTIPVNHTTGAALLLAQAGIEPLVRGIIGRKHLIKNPNYTMTQEKRRGVLRIHGRGEGTDPTPGYDNESVQDQFSDSTPGDTHSEDSSPSQERDFPGITSPPDYPPSHLAQLPGLDEDFQEKTPEFSRDVVFKLVESYQANINNMHPILTPRHLRAMVEIFLRSLPENQTKPKVMNTSIPHAHFIGGASNRNPDSPSNKRKRSPAGDYQEISSGDVRKQLHPDRSISSAIVLCVLALGEVCLHKTKLPDVADIFPVESENANSPVARNGYPPSPIQNSPASRRPSVEGHHQKVDNSKLRNADYFPGLAYFGLATEIIGNQLGGNSLQHVHVNILAGLYHGQLGRVLESHAYISKACCSLQNLLYGKMHHFKRLHDNCTMVSAKDNPYVFAFWTCLQLESDIIAELPVTQSGILTLEEDMPPPNLKVAEEVNGFDPRILESYTAQLFLRKHLNTLHSILYQPKDGQSDEEDQNSKLNGKRDPTHADTIDALGGAIAVKLGWAPNMMWNDETGERSNRILDARLRAKWYGAQVITYRPFILQILDFSAKTSPSTAHNQAMMVVPPTFVHGVDAPVISPNATSPADIPVKTMEYARKGLLALIHSTSAFHDVVDTGNQRLIVTNIWGTAHAQWGNLVTLQAAFNDPILQPELMKLITKDNLRILLEKTMAFVNFNAPKSSALYSDWRILKHIGQQLGLLPPSAKATPKGGVDSANASFHSVASNDRRETVMSGVYQS